MATDIHKTDAKGDAKSDTKLPAPAPNAGLVRKPSDPHPAGRVKHSLAVQVLRGFSFGVYFAACCLAYDAPCLYDICDMEYGDTDGAGQIYTDWLYLWWVAYANSPSMHGHIYIILKESLKYIPGVGAGMMFYGFIFMSRKMSTDQPRLAHRLQKLKKQHIGANGNKYLDPMWLLLFPEGTNLSTNGRRKSAAWAKKNDLKDPEHVLLPRSTGTFFCLNELKGSLDYVYDCTVAYEGVPRGKFGDQFFTLTSTYFQGRPPKSVNFHWRRFHLADIPLDDAKVFDTWLRERWYEKDAIMEEYLSTGRFPASQDLKGGFVETEVRLKSWIELGQIFVVLGIAGLVLRIVANSITRFASVL
ncbi:acyltransferase [Colletotrichum nymphaeae SA-01]|uniref:Acyltransferase n=1 Tax=Colletotrichum nymphaeae SA-01 TaxID=1460502 RepID=A0A135S9K3_9PEZI|nr:acyltransferase [Colletotrichum nymphaeae SA-01]